METQPDPKPDTAPPSKPKLRWYHFRLRSCRRAEGPSFPSSRFRLRSLYRCKTPSGYRAEGPSVPSSRFRLRSLDRCKTPSGYRAEGPPVRSSRFRLRSLDRCKTPSGYRAEGPPVPSSRFRLRSLDRCKFPSGYRAEGPPVRPAQGNALGRGKTPTPFSAQRANRSPVVFPSFSPEGTSVVSQGCEPLENARHHQQSPNGATVESRRDGSNPESSAIPRAGEFSNGGRSLHGRFQTVCFAILRHSRAPGRHRRLARANQR
jgi:hypothetical protein